MLQAKSRAWLEIDCDAVRHNIKEVQKLLPSSTQIMAVVKANCYGHGDAKMAQVMQAQGLTTFAVSSVDEALNLLIFQILFQKSY